MEARVERVGESERTDGLWIDRRGRLYLTAIEDDAVKIRDGGRDAILVRDARLRWPDSFSEGPDGTLYVTSSRIQDMSWFKPGNGPRLATMLWRIEGAGREVTRRSRRSFRRSAASRRRKRKPRGPPFTTLSPPAGAPPPTRCAVRTTTRNSAERLRNR